MKKTRLVSLIVANVVCVAAIFAVGLVWCGCESDENTESSSLDQYFANNPQISDPRYDPESSFLAIDPDRATISVEGGQVEFSVSGGRGPYRWDVSDTAVGTISAISDGEEAIYTSITLGGNYVIVSDTTGGAAIGEIEGTAASLSVIPSSATIESGGPPVVFTVSGGSAPYAWHVSRPAFGSVNPTTGDQVTYSRITDGENTLIVEDHFGDTASVTISQPGPLTILPPGAAITVQGQTVQFSASGGMQPYTWSVGNSALGTVDANGLYSDSTNTTTTANSVTVWDSAGASDSATITQP